MKCFIVASLSYFDVKNGEIIHTPPLLLFRLAREDRQGRKRRDMLNRLKKIDQDLGFVPLITARNLAGRQKNVKNKERLSKKPKCCDFIKFTYRKINYLRV